MTRSIHTILVKRNVSNYKALNNTQSFCHMHAENMFAETVWFLNMFKKRGDITLLERICFTFSISVPDSTNRLGCTLQWTHFKAGNRKKEVEITKNLLYFLSKVVSKVSWNRWHNHLLGMLHTSCLDTQSGLDKLTRSLPSS